MGQALTSLGPSAPLPTFYKVLPDPVSFDSPWNPKHVDEAQMREVTVQGHTAGQRKNQD